MTRPARPYALVLAATLAALASAASSPALANVAAISRSPDRVDGPLVSTPTPLVVEREELEIDCASRAAPLCTFRAHYHLRNPTDAPQGVVAAFYGVRSDDVHLTVDGAPSERALTDEERGALDAALASVQPHGGSAGRSAAHQRYGFELHIGPGGTSELVATGVMRPGPRNNPGGYALPSIRARHLALWTNAAEETLDFEYLVAPIRTWASAGPIQVTVIHREGWTFRGAMAPGETLATDTAPGHVAAWTREAGDGRVRERATVDARDGELLVVSLHRDASPLHHGGPFVGVGGSFGENSGLRVRFGYELAAPDWAIYSLAVDTDFSRRVVLAPAVEAALPWIALLPLVPSLALGVGVPVRVAPTPAVGARVFGTANLGPVGFVTTLDVFPSDLNANTPGGVEVSMMARLSF